MPKGLSPSGGVAGVASLLAALGAGAGAALARAPTRPAGAERELVWYTAMNTPDAAPLRKLFREKYPEVNLTILRQPGEKIRTRILTEMRAGKFFWDVVSFNHLDIDALAQEGLLLYALARAAKAAVPARPQPARQAPGRGRFSAGAGARRRNGRGEAGRGARRLGEDPRSGDHLAEPGRGVCKGAASQRRAPLRGSAALGGGPGAYPRPRTRARAQRPRARARPGSAETALRGPAARARSRSARKRIPRDISARSLIRVRKNQAHRHRQRPIRAP